VFLRYFLHSVTTSKILISGIPMQTRFEDIEPLLKPYGIVKQCEAISSKDQNTQTVHITFENPEQAQRYIPKTTHFKTIHLIQKLSKGLFFQPSTRSHVEPLISSVRRGKN